MARIRKVKPQDQHLQLEKRCYYVPGYQIEDSCIKCGAVNIWDGNESYLSYPILGEPEKLYFFCECGYDQSDVDESIEGDGDGF